jgi:ABC-type polar amino acid transport system ATPase subunit
MKDCSCSEHDNKFKHPFTCIISGPSGSGKSFCIRLLQNLNTLRTEPDFFGGIVWCHSEKRAVPTKELDKLKKKITYCHDMPTRFAHVQGLSSLIILDDPLNEAYSREVCDLFTKVSHHRNLSVNLITKNLFHQGRHCRDISLNAKYLVSLKTYVTKISFYI